MPSLREGGPEKLVETAAVNAHEPLPLAEWRPLRNRLRSASHPLLLTLKPLSHVTEPKGTEQEEYQDGQGSGDNLDLDELLGDTPTAAAAGPDMDLDELLASVPTAATAVFAAKQRRISNPPPTFAGERSGWCGCVGTDHLRCLL